MLRMEETKKVSNGDQNNDNTAEQHKLSLMRVYVEGRDPSSKEVDNLTLRRFLRARNLNVEKGGAMFLKYQEWKRTFLPKGYVSEAEIQYELSHHKILLGGQDKKGCPIAVAIARRHFQSSRPEGLDEIRRFAVYTLDKLCTRMPDGEEKFLAIGDLQGWGYSNSDIRGYLAALSILQEYYPERLGKAFIVHAPKTFMAVWKIIYPFIDENTRAKIEFVETKKLTPTLLEEIDESQLPDLYGGKFSLVPVQSV